ASGIDPRPTFQAAGPNSSACPVAVNDGLLTVDGKRSDSQPLTDPYPVGQTTITWTIWARGFEASTCTETVTVKAAEKPNFGAIAAVTASPEPGTCSATVSLPPATDTCGTPTVVYKVGDQTIPSPHDFPVGTTTVDCTATDAAGNTATARF